MHIRRTLKWNGIALAGIALVILAQGCSGSRKDVTRGPAFVKVYTPEAPRFLNGPVVVLLTNASGFSARVAMGRQPTDLEAPVNGQLLARGSRLVFLPDQIDAREKHIRIAGFGFIWDAASNSGYLLSDALQGYAPMAGRLQVTNVVIGPRPGAAEKISGHSCAPATALLQLSNGTNTTYDLLRASDLRDLPMRITSTGNTPPFSLSLTKVRLETPQPDLFEPPPSFTKYPSPEVMVDELAMRQNNLRSRPAPPPSELPPELQRR